MANAYALDLEVTEAIRQHGRGTEALVTRALRMTETTDYA